MLGVPCSAPPRRAAVVLVVVAVTAITPGCAADEAGPVNVTATDPPAASDPPAPGATDSADMTHPDVIDVEASFDDASGTWSFAVTISSPYDTPERYADGWRVVGPDGTVYGVHTLTHDHANEQPFTRRQSSVEIPDDVSSVTIEGRDLVNGFGGGTMTIDLTDQQTG